MNDKEGLLSEMVELSIARSQSTGRALEFHRDLLEASLPPLANDLWAAGWRKMPSREQIIEALMPKPEGMVADSETWLSIREKMTAYYERDADAILALMDGPTETGDSE